MSCILCVARFVPAIAADGELAIANRQGVFYYGVDPVSEQEFFFKVYNKMHVVIVGVGEYANVDPSLHPAYAVAEARGLKKMLSERYQVDHFYELYDKAATKRNIWKLLKVDLATVGPNDAVLFFFSGLSVVKGKNKGYLVPYDGSLDLKNKNAASKLISFDDLTKRIARGIPAHHQAYLISACIGDRFAKSTSLGKKQVDLFYLDDMSKDKCSLIITAGLSGDYFATGGWRDYSMFASYLMEYLDERRDFVSFLELSSWSFPRIVESAKSEGKSQKPLSSRFAGQGDFFLVPDPLSDYKQFKVGQIMTNQELNAILADIQAGNLPSDEDALRKLQKRITELEEEVRQQELTEQLLIAKITREEELYNQYLQDELKIKIKQTGRSLVVTAAKEELDRARQELHQANISPPPKINQRVETIARLRQEIARLQAGSDQMHEQIKAQMDIYVEYMMGKVRRLTPQDEFETSREFDEREKQQGEVVEQRTLELQTKRQMEAIEYDNTVRQLLKSKRKQICVLASKNLVFTEGFQVRLLRYVADEGYFPLELELDSMREVFSLKLIVVRDRARKLKANWGKVKFAVKGKIWEGTQEGSFLFVPEAVVVTDTTGDTFEALLFRTIRANPLKETLIYGDHQAGETFVDSFGIKYVYIPAGSFNMGSVQGKEDNSPVHVVNINNGFWMSATEITQGQWSAVMGAHSGDNFVGPDIPVHMVSWEDAQSYVDQLSTSNTQDYFYRLPTEAEWEYAARAGSKTLFSYGDDEESLEQYAWFAKNAGERVNKVAQLEPNKWGLYDIMGNVYEWCSDYYNPTYYDSSVAEDPYGPATGRDSMRVRRGGSWGDTAWNLRVANRFASEQQARYSIIGFRIIMIP